MTNRQIEATYPGLRTGNQQAASPVQARRGPSVAALVAAAPVLLVTILAVALFDGWVFLKRMEHLYRNHIYPNVYALGVDLGGMSRSQAAEALEDVAGYVDTGLLVLTDDEARWSYPWSKAGIYVDVHATAEAAYTVGRDGTVKDQADVWLTYHDVAPHFAFDTAAARGLLAELSKEVSQPPVDASFKLEGGEVTIVDGEAGRVLDIPATLAKLRNVGGTLYRVEIPLIFEIVEPMAVETDAVTAQAETLLARQITVSAYDVLTEETLSWTLDRDEIAAWLYLVPGADGEPTVDVNQYAIRDTLITLAETMGDGRGFRSDAAAAQIFRAFDAGESHVWVYLTHPERTYTVVAGDTLTSLSAKFGMPPGLVAQANSEIDINKLSVGQQIRIPSQDVLTPYRPVLEKKIVVNIAEQHTRVYENGQLIYDWVSSTGIESSPTHRGTFQVLEKHEEAYASQWDLWMPYFISVYPAGGGVQNGFHELPILANGTRLWEGALGRPASYGCIILGIPAAKTLYDWAEVGVPVIIE
jgi:lipoprotein-anchoring transpeptidase ErfK/SrfK